MARHSARETLLTHDDFRVRANAWQAHRHGLEGTLADLDTGQPQPVSERIARETYHALSADMKTLTTT